MRCWKEGRRLGLALVSSRGSEDGGVGHSQQLKSRAMEVRAREGAEQCRK